MEDHRAAGGGVLRRRGRAAGPAHGLRRGRREAIDLLLPGRRSRGLRRHAPAFRPAPREPGQRAGGGAAHHLLPLDGGGAGGGRCHLRPGPRPGGRQPRRQAHRPSGGKAGPGRPCRALAFGRAATPRARSRLAPAAGAPRRRFAARASGQAHRAPDQGHAGARRAPGEPRPSGAAGGFPDPAAPSRRAGGCAGARAEGASGARRRHRPHALDRATRRPRSHRLRPIPAAARGRFQPGGAAEEPAPRLERGGSLRARP